MKLNPPASSSDLEAAREIARRLHQRRRREDLGAPRADAPLRRHRPAPAADSGPAPAPQRRASRLHPPCRPAGTAPGTPAAGLVRTSPRPTRPRPRSTESRPPADLGRARGPPPRRRSLTIDPPTSASDGRLAGGDGRLAGRSPRRPDRTGRLPGSSRTWQPSPRLRPRPSRWTSTRRGAQPGTTWSRGGPPVVGRRRGRAASVSRRRGRAMLVDPAGQVFAARGEWPEPGPNAIAAKLVSTMDRTLKDAPTRSISAPLDGQAPHRLAGPARPRAWSRRRSSRDAPVRAEARPAIDTEIHRAAGT